MLAEALKSVASNVEELTDTGSDTDVTAPIVGPNENTNLSPVASCLELAADRQRKALDACPVANMAGLTLKFTPGLVWA